MRSSWFGGGRGGRTINGKNYFGPQGGECICPLTESVLVYSPREEWLTQWAMRLMGPDAGGPLRPALDLAAGGPHHLVAGFAPPRQVRDQIVNGLLGPVPGLRPEHGLTQPDPRPVAEILSADLTADLKSRADGAASDGLQV